MVLFIIITRFIIYLEIIVAVYTIKLGIYNAPAAALVSVLTNHSLQSFAPDFVSSRNGKFLLPLRGLSPAVKKLFFKKIPLILLALVWGGATPATPNVFGNCFLLHP